MYVCVYVYICIYIFVYVYVYILLGAASKNGGDNMDEGMSRQRHGGTLAGEPPLTVNRLKCLWFCMKRRVFIGFTSVS